MEELADRCRRESERFSRGQEQDQRYCLELFRRAVVQRDEQAWECVYQQYGAQVARWVRAHPSFDICQEEVAYFVNATFTQFWKYVSFPTSPTLGGLLEYLKKCVATAIIDHVRANDKAGRRSDWDADQIAETPDDRDEPSPDEHLDAQHLEALVQSLLKSEQERVVVESRFFFGMSPRAIQAQHPQLFGDVAEVYDCLANVLKRLGRHPELRMWAR